ncbi:MAG: class A beta-lactamase-related serine hydrolase, partial [Chryseobacterium sp.]
MKQYKAILFIFLIPLLTGKLTFAQADKVDRIDAFIDKSNQSGAFNGNILIAEGGKVIIKKSVGYADASKQIRLNSRYRFHIGSIAKEFDAVGIMMLQEQGRLNINNKVSKFFPELPDWAKTISIKNLLQYTSGLPEIKYKTVHHDSDNWKDL